MTEFFYDREIEVRYMALVFQLHQESKALYNENLRKDNIKTDGLLIKNVLTYHDFSADFRVVNYFVGCRP